MKITTELVLTLDRATFRFGNDGMHDGVEIEGRVSSPENAGFFMEARIEAFLEIPSDEIRGVEKILKEAVSDMQDRGELVMRESST